MFCDSLESELESLRESLLKARLDPSPPKTKSKSLSANLSMFCDTSVMKKAYVKRSMILTATRFSSVQDITGETVPAAQLPLKGTDAACPLDCTRYEYSAQTD